MTLHAFDTTVERIPGTEVTVRVPIWSSEPGTVTASAPGCTFPDGNQKAIVGTRTWAAKNRDNSDGFNVPAAGATAIAGREGVTIGFDFDPAVFQHHPDNAAMGTMVAYNYSVTRRINWMIYATKTANLATYAFRYAQSNNTTSNETAAVISGNLDMSDGPIRCVVTLVTTSVKLYINNNTLHQDTLRTAPDGTIANPYCKIGPATRLAYWGSVLDSAGIASYTAGSIPGAPVVAYTMQEESPAKPYDASANAYDGVYDLDSTYPASQIARSFTDSPGDPVVPASSIRVTIPAGVASPVTLTLSRPRQGVPARASDAEKTETTTGTITITDIPAKVFCGPSQEVRTRL